MGDPPTVRGPNELILVAAGHDEVGRTVRRLTNVLGLQIAATRRAVAVDHDLVIGNDVLTRIERLQRTADTRLDRVAADQVLGQVRRGIGQEDLVEVVPIPAVEGPRVADRQIHDGLPVESESGRIVDAVQGLEAEGNRGRVHHFKVVAPELREAVVVTTVLGHPVQIAYAVDPDVDLTDAAHEFRVRTGAGPFVVAEHIAVRSAVITGQPARFDHSSAYGQWGSLMVELVQEHTPSVIGRTTGLHHLAYLVESLDATIESCARRGWPLLLDATTSGGQRFVFCDARESLGHLVELYEPSAPLLAFYEHVRGIARPVG